MGTHIYFHVKENREDIPIMSPELALCLILISSNYPCLEHIFMAPKMFEPFKFYCIFSKCYISFANCSCVFFLYLYILEYTTCC